MMSRNGSRGTAKVDSASSLEHSAGVPPSGQHPHPLPHPHQQQQQQQQVAAVQEQLAKTSLAE